MNGDLISKWNEQDAFEDLPPVAGKLYLENLPVTATEDDLRSLFSAFGNVVDINVAVDRASPNPCGFGFVTMATADEARCAIRFLNRKVIKARILTVNGAYPSGLGVRSPKGRRASRDLLAHHHLT